MYERIIHYGIRKAAVMEYDGVRPAYQLMDGCSSAEGYSKYEIVRENFQGSSHDFKRGAFEASSSSGLDSRAPDWHEVFLQTTSSQGDDAPSIIICRLSLACALKQQVIFTLFKKALLDQKSERRRLKLRAQKLVKMAANIELDKQATESLMKNLLQISHNYSSSNLHQGASDGSAASKSYQLCPRIRYYRVQQQQQQPPQRQQFEILQFSNRQFDAARYSPAELASDLADMRFEANRLLSLQLPAVWTGRLSGQIQRQLARTGWFLGKEQNTIRCAFCYGSLNSATVDTYLANYHLGELEDNGWWALRMHLDQFATCPMMLCLQVGNRPCCETKGEKSYDGRAVSSPVACQEEANPEALDSWRQAADAPSSEAEGRLQLRLRCGLPTASLATAKSACDPRADLNLQLLEQSLTVTASVSYPMSHPEMSDLDLRLASLVKAASLPPSVHDMRDGGQELSASAQLPPDVVASAGFFCSDERKADLLTCFWCGIQLRHWLPTDEPWVEHARWSPRCCHLLLERGSKFVLEVRRLHPPYLPEGVELTPASAQPDNATPKTNLNKSTTSVRSAVIYCIEPRLLRAREDTHGLCIVRRLLDHNDARTAMAEQLRLYGDDFATSQMLLSACLAVQRQRQPLGLSALQYHDRRTAELDQVLQVDAVPLDIDSEMDWRACKVCMDRQINVILIDCKHFCCCSNCCRSLSSCPLCRAPIRAILLIRNDEDNLTEPNV